MHMDQSFDHLINNKTNGLPIKFPLRWLLQHVKQSLLHQLKDHENMRLTAASLPWSGWGLLRESAQQVNDVRVSLKKLQEGNLSFGDSLSLW